MNNILKAAAIVVAASTGIATPTLAETNVTAEEATRKVNIAGRQRMLSQRMAKAACLMSQELSYGSSFDQMALAYELFERSDYALRHGNADMGLQPEAMPSVLNALSNIDEHWLLYHVIIEDSITNGKVNANELEELDASGLQVLKFMNIAVFQTARSYADVSPDLPLGVTITVDVAGRQRMLSQRAVKEACMMRVAEDPSIYATRLSETVHLFDLSLNALLAGFEPAGVIAAPTTDIENKLREVRTLWVPIKDMMDRAANGEVLSDADLIWLAAETEPLLRTMNEAVGLYEFISAN
ncbi:type IV pili methyl-accepting chemotaxis transducer N-terminal domain-containing protein [Yoonia maritima]|uniref:type IV pili methyl-accepting chemotaxis transducer N-terminal domain-containing protein n=1 Tax=Yoonia maritima TaxID=1435347 RepID=UPI000D0EAA34|nr:type IV pili methyl-accepting chemotaxis transducer N-terminal domain-containing protein [Yoonia maritima]